MQLSPTVQDLNKFWRVLSHRKTVRVPLRRGVRHKSKMHSMVVFQKLPLLLILTISSLFLGTSLGQAESIPNFWDPKAVVDKPANIPDKIQFVSTDEHPPFVFRDTDGRLTGFHIDLARAVCNVLESSCSLRIKPFAELIPALEDEEADAIIAGLAQTPDRATVLSFSDPYLKLPARFVVRETPPSDFNPAFPEGRRIAVEAGSRHEAFIRRFWPGAEIVTFDDMSAARQALKEGKVDAHFGDGLSLSFWLRGEESAGCCAFVGGPWLEPGFFDEGLSIALRKDDRDRLEAINYALRQVYQSGTYRELYLRYFPLSFF